MVIWILVIFSVISSFSSPSCGYDPLDPHGNITIAWDLILQYGNIYDITVSIRNNQLFRHVEKPGWRVSWAWKGEQVIWNMWGAEATEQGNCSASASASASGGQLPHCCHKHPQIVDLMPSAPYNLQVSNCCKGGILASLIQSQSQSQSHLSAFRMIVVSSNGSGSQWNLDMATNFSVGLPGYTCGHPFQVSPTRFRQEGSRRCTQALETWNVNCVYSQFRASTAPNCCVSLSAFYNDTIVPCPKCSCNCQGLSGPKCVKANQMLQLPHGRSESESESESLVRCSKHMCPIRVHWHVKQSYRKYWRVKITITNLNFIKNYSHWNLVVLHPNLQSVTQVFSFNYRSLNQYGNINDSGMFWGIEYYNDMLPKSGESGNVQTEMLLDKDAGIFTFKQGWAFPRKISFNGDHCVMPPPDQYPTLPNTTPILLTPPLFFFFLLAIFFYF